MSNRLQVGIDFHLKTTDFCLLFPDGEPLETHVRFANSLSGYSMAKRLLIDALKTYSFDGIDISGEATGVLWMPYFLHLAADADLTLYDPNLFLLNPRWVKWFKKSLNEEEKRDDKDPFYIAERTRTRRPRVTWSPSKYLPLRFYTRLRFHLTHNIAREKTYFSAFLFLKASSYRCLKPFSDVFGATSRLVLTQSPSIDELTQLPVDDLAIRLQELSGNSLPDPDNNASKLKRVAEESFPLDDSLRLPVDRILDITLQHIRFLEDQVAQVNDWIATEVEAYPAICNLATIPGIGPVFSAGIGAEIGGVDRFLQGTKWDRKRKRYRPRNLRDAEDAIAKIAGLWWPRSGSGEFEAEDRHLAKSGNRYLRYYTIEGANMMRRYAREYGQYYWRKYKEATKHHHKRALVLTARKGIGLFVGLLHRNEPYRPEGDRKT
jgi:hypothetical protein